MVKKTTKEIKPQKQKLFTNVPILQNKNIMLRPLILPDAPDLQKLVDDEIVYRYLPTFLFEKQQDVNSTIRKLYDKKYCFKDSIIYGIYDQSDGSFCGLFEFYGYKDKIHKVSVGYRLCSDHWGGGVATRALEAAVDYLLLETDIEIITASTMIENRSSEHVLLKNKFELVSSNVEEDWGFVECPARVDKWIR